jgi:hypothetical protein
MLPFLAVALVAFAIAFAVARAASGGPPKDRVAAPQPHSYQPVAINNLEKVPNVKPLRSAPGAPPATSATSATSANPQGAK